MKKKYKFLIIILIVFNLYFWFGVFSIFSQKGKVCFLDVGQGDAELIKLPYGVNFLIDAGPNNHKILFALENNLPFYKKRIEAVFISHTDSDHWEGLNDVLKNYQVNAFFWNNILPNHKTTKNKFLKTISLIKRKNILVKNLKYPETIYFAGYKFYILWPTEKNYFKSTNNNSLIILAESPSGKKILFTGDIQKGAEKKLVSLFGKSLNSDILKVPHHGAKSSFEKSFFEIVNPKKAVIEVGKNNPYHHPNQNVLNFFHLLKAQIYRTDENGSFCFNFY